MSFRDIIANKQQIVRLLLKFHGFPFFKNVTISLLPILLLFLSFSYRISTNQMNQETQQEAFLQEPPSETTSNHPDNTCADDGLDLS